MTNPLNTTHIYTIGYATKPIETFIGQLKRYNISAVADIRSVPYSKIFHQYHKEHIAQELNNQGIRYVYLGEELGPRSKDKRHYDNHGQVQFDRLMKSALFIQGLKRLGKGIERNYNIALMCAEKDPATCHRSLLVGYFLAHHTNKTETKLKLPTELLHINHNGEIETQSQLEERIAIQNSKSQDLFMSKTEADYQAYQLQLKKTSYINIDLKEE